MSEHPMGLDHTMLDASEQYQLLELAAGGDVAARNRVIEHLPRLIWSITKGLPGERLELYQVGMVAAIKAAGSFPCNGGTASAYIARAAKRAMIDWSYPDRKRVDSRPELDSLTGLPDGWEESVIKPWAPLEDDDRDHMRRVLDQVFYRASLSCNEKLCVSLKHGLNCEGELSYAQIAERLGIGKTTAKDTYDRAISKLRTAGDGIEFRTTKKEMRQ